MNIRQQTPLRSALVCTAERGLGRGKPQTRIRVVEPIHQLKRPDYGFLLDEASCNDKLTARFPRTAREAFGPYSFCGETLPKRITFLDCYRARPRGVAMIGVLFVVAALVGWGWK